MTKMWHLKKKLRHFEFDGCNISQTRCTQRKQTSPKAAHALGSIYI